MPRKKVLLTLFPYFNNLVALLVVHIQLILLYLLELCEVFPYLLSTLDLRKTKTSAVLECVSACVCLCVNETHTLAHTNVISD